MIKIQELPVTCQQDNHWYRAWRKMTVKNACREIKCFKYVSRGIWYCCGLGDRRKHKTLASCKWRALSFHRSWLCEPDRASCPWSAKKSDFRVRCTDFRVWTNISLSLSYVAHPYVLPNDRKKGACRAAPLGRNAYSGVFCLRRTWLPTPWRMWLSGPSQSTLPHSSYPFVIRREDVIASVNGACSVVVK